jgi:hypothetical protein
LRLLVASLVWLRLLVITGYSGQSERKPVSIEAKFAEESTRAVGQNTVGDFLTRHRHDERLWVWLNSDRVDMRLFLATAKELSGPERERSLSPGRQLVLRYYDIAVRADQKEPRPAYLTKLDQLRLSIGLHPEQQPDSRDAVRVVLAQSDPNVLLDQSHKALFVYSFLAAANAPDLVEIVQRLMAGNTTFLGEASLFSLAAQTYGPPFIKLLAEACERSKPPADCVRLIERATVLRRLERESEQEFARRTLAWYEANKSRLVLNRSALYPSPPFKPLFTVEAAR